MADKTNIYGWDGTQWVKILVNAEGKLIIDPPPLPERTPATGRIAKPDKATAGKETADAG